MKQKIVIGIVIGSIILGLSGMVYGLMQMVSDLRQGTVSIHFGAEAANTLDTSALDYDQLVEQVAPAAGITIPVNWGDMGQKLIESGAIDLEKFDSLYNGLSEEQQAILLGDELTEITFTRENIQFWTNVLWALGLVQESQVLNEGPMQQNAWRTPLGNYASTGGWTVGSKPATELYNSAQLIDLTPEQNELIYQVAANVFRPCCANHTAFPDCNHGMAVLALLELLASQGATETQLYEAALAFNSYAFVNSYVRVAAFFALQDIPWLEVSARVILSPAYSSAYGAQQVAAAIGPITGSPYQGGSCGT